MNRGENRFGRLHSIRIAGTRKVLTLNDRHDTLILMESGLCDLMRGENGLQTY
jgi:hypothetical protein